MKTLIKICSIIATLAIISSLGLKQVEHCNNFSFNIPEFNSTLFSGMWYPIYRSEHCCELMNIDCISFDVEKSLTSNDLFFNTVHRRDLNSALNYRLPLRMLQTPNSFLGSFRDTQHVFTIVNTDYLNYALIYICNDTMPKSYSAVILSRTNMLPQADLTRLMDYTRNTLLIQDRFIPIAQDELTCSAIVSWRRERDYDY